MQPATCLPRSSCVERTASEASCSIHAISLSWPQEIDITTLGTSVATALQAAFSVLFGNTRNLPLTFAVLYGYEMVAPSSTDPEGLVTYLPVTLYPNQASSSNTTANIAAALTAWQSASLPAQANGEWVIGLSLYSQIDPAQKELLMSVESLIYKLFDRCLTSLFLESLFGCTGSSGFLMVIQ
jgi:hypothetical protein